ncbi:hypothetical protein Droror1_Dr00008103 [Drosera rotundifolia]
MSISRSAIGARRSSTIHSPDTGFGRLRIPGRFQLRRLQLRRRRPLRRLYGRTFFHSPAGRYCDRRLLIDFIAERLGLPYLSAYLDTMGSNFSHRANFATAGATVRPQNTTRSQSGVSSVSLDVQLVEFSNFRARSQPIRQKGFEEPLVACCGHGGKYNFNNAVRCGSTRTVNGTEILIARLCKDPSLHVSWDGIHYSEAGNKWIFNQIVNRSFSDPPVPLRMACHRSTDAELK